jgi:hypothetical protein
VTSELTRQPGKVRVPAGPRRRNYRPAARADDCDQQARIRARQLTTLAARAFRGPTAAAAGARRPAPAGQREPGPRRPRDRTAARTSAATTHADPCGADSSSPCRVRYRSDRRTSARTDPRLVAPDCLEPSARQVYRRRRRASANPRPVSTRAGDAGKGDIPSLEALHSPSRRCRGHGCAACGAWNRRRGRSRESRHDDGKAFKTSCAARMAAPVSATPSPARTSPPPPPRMPWTRALSSTSDGPAGWPRPDTAALANVLAHRRVTAADGPLSEPLLFLVGGGLGAGYILWEFAHDDGRVVTSASPTPGSTSTGGWRRRWTGSAWTSPGRAPAALRARPRRWPRLSAPETPRSSGRTVTTSATGTCRRSSTDTVAIRWSPTPPRGAGCTSTTARSHL